MSTSYANIGFFISLDFRRDRIYLFFLEIALPGDFLDQSGDAFYRNITRFHKTFENLFEQWTACPKCIFNKIRTSNSSSAKLRLLAQTADLGDCRMHDVIGFEVEYWGFIFMCGQQFTWNLIKDILKALIKDMGFYWRQSYFAGAKWHYKIEVYFLD